MAMHSVVSLTTILQTLPLNKAPGPDFVSAELFAVRSKPDPECWSRLRQDFTFSFRTWTRTRI